ncbi:MAG: hypothetical protein ACODAG_01750 [Myxococcota bacterium]
MRHAWIALTAALALLGAPGAQAQAPADAEEPEDASTDPAAADDADDAEAGEAGEADDAEAGEADEADDAEAGEADEADAPEAGEATEGSEASEESREADLTTASPTTGSDPDLDSPAEEGEATPDAAEAGGLTPSGANRAKASAEDGKIIPLDVALHGFYRARWNWLNNVPREDPDGVAGPIIPGTNDLSFGYHRLRLEPTVTYGPKKDAPIAALRMQIDALDNVVFGDNAAIGGVPLFAENPSLTNIGGFDLQDSFFLKRAWLEFLIPVGQIQVGRMPSHWAQGLLAHGGEGLAEWGDFIEQTTFDRILFATRPLTVYNALAKGDSRPTPLIFALAYDRLVEQPGRGGDRIVGPLTTSDEDRSRFPFQWLGDKDNQVNELVQALIWKDDDFGRLTTDHLTLGAYFVYRWQNDIGAKAFISDIMWDFQYGMGAGLPSFFTEGEVMNIRAKGETPIAGLLTDANIWAALGRAGVVQPDEYKFFLEAGFDSGDETLATNPELKTRPFHENVKVGLLMYQVAMLSVSNRQLLPQFNALGANGSAWNTKYFWPQGRYSIMDGVEVHGGFLVGWAHKLNQVFSQPDGSACGFGGDCFLGWEVDAALRLRWGDNDLMWLDIESAIMKPGDALTRDGDTQNAGGLSDDWGDMLWTVQMRVAMMF